MKRKLLFNAIGIVMSLSLLTTVSYALFTSSASVSGNRLTNGTVVTTVYDGTTNNGVTAFGSDPLKGSTTLLNSYTRQPYIVSNGNAVAVASNELNLVAGDSVSRTIRLQNEGTLDQFYRFYFTNVSFSNLGQTDLTPAALEQFYDIKIIGTNAHGSNTTGDTAFNAKYVKFDDLMGSGNSIAGFLNATGIKGMSWVNLGHATYSIQITLRSDAPQCLQGATLSFDIQVDTVQAVHNYEFKNFDGARTDMLHIDPSLITWG